MAFRPAWLFVLIGLLVFGLGQPACAALYDVSVGAGDVSFSPPELILDTPSRIYATVSNNGERDVEGVVRFYDNDVLIGTKFFSVRANMRPEDTWVRWTPQGYGAHTIRVVVENDDAFPDASPGNNGVSAAIFVDRDADRDGVPDQQDDDRDNDTVLNAEETRRGTDPLRRDTDGDGVDDPKDAFPLDARRSVVPPPTPAPTPKPASKPTVQSTVTARRAVTATPSVSTAEAVSTNAARADSDSLVVTSSGIGIETVTGTEVTVEASAVTNSSSGTLSPAEDASRIESDVAVHQSSSGTRNVLGNWLVLAAILSALAAGTFIWLGRRR